MARLLQRSDHNGVFVLRKDGPVLANVDRNKEHAVRKEETFYMRHAKQYSGAEGDGQ